MSMCVCKKKTTTKNRIDVEFSNFAIALKAKEDKKKTSLLRIYKKKKK